MRWGVACLVVAAAGTGTDAENSDRAVCRWGFAATSRDDFSQAGTPTGERGSADILATQVVEADDLGPGSQVSGYRLTAYVGGLGRVIDAQPVSEYFKPGFVARTLPALAPAPGPTPSGPETQPKDLVAAFPRGRETWASAVTRWARGVWDDLFGSAARQLSSSGVGTRLYRVGYTSRLRNLKDLHAVVLDAFRTHKRLGLGGRIWCREDGRLSHSLEGPYDAVRSQVLAVRSDPRHTDVTVETEEFPAFRAFNGWQALPAPVSARDGESTTDHPRIFTRRFRDGFYSYKLQTRFSRGGHGEIWRAIKHSGLRSGGPIAEPPLEDVPFIMKRMLLERGDDILLCGRREIYFGMRVRGYPDRFARFHEFFFRYKDEDGSRPVDDAAEDADVIADGTSADRESSDAGPGESDAAHADDDGDNSGDEGPDDGVPRSPSELWLVFSDEGRSLQSLLYSSRMASAGQSVIFTPAPFWERLRTTASGAAFLKHIFREILRSLSVLHENLGITHRDLKPSNILVDIHASPPTVKIADFSSAVDPTAARRLYGEAGPSRDEESRPYMPPEVLFQDAEAPSARPRDGKKSTNRRRARAYDVWQPTTFDIWSAGVVFMEVLLGTSHVFVPDNRARVILEHQLRGQSKAVREQAFILSGMADYCIWSREMQSPYRHTAHSAVVSSSCNFAEFNRTLRRRDPLDIGFNDDWGLHLIWSMLQWAPRDRVSATEALDHAFFVGPHVASDGSLHGTRRARDAHDASLRAEASGLSRSGNAQGLGSMGSASVSGFTLYKGEVDIESLNFSCPECGRRFQSQASCAAHMHGRRHDRGASAFCSFEFEALPTCYSAHPMTLYHAASGWCDYQSRRPYMEDVHSLRIEAHARHGHAFYGVYDGHMGSGAAKFVSRVIDDEISLAFDSGAAQVGVARIADTLRWPNATQVLSGALARAFAQTDAQFLSERGSWDVSGSTTTVALLFDDPATLVVANVGDSSAVLCCGAGGQGVPATTDHWPSLPGERARIEARGGRVETHGTIARINGSLAISRSIGDEKYRLYLSREPAVRMFPLDSGPNGNQPPLQFAIVATDGLWDEVTKEEAVRHVQESLSRTKRDTIDDTPGGTGPKGELPSSAFQEAATRLAKEALARGSSDNIGVLVLDLQRRAAGTVEPGDVN